MILFSHSYVDDMSKEECELSMRKSGGVTEVGLLSISFHVDDKKLEFKIDKVVAREMRAVLDEYINDPTGVNDANDE